MRVVEAIRTQGYRGWNRFFGGELKSHKGEKRIFGGGSPHLFPVLTNPNYSALFNIRLFSLSRNIVSSVKTQGDAVYGFYSRIIYKYLIYKRKTQTIEVISNISESLFGELFRWFQEFLNNFPSVCEITFWHFSAISISSKQYQ